MNNNLLILFLIFLYSNVSFSAPCEGRGTVFYFGNGMFNTWDDAQDSREFLSKEVKAKVQTDNHKDIVFDVSYKTNEALIEQFKNVVLQKKIDNFESFWLWMNSL